MAYTPGVLISLKESAQIFNMPILADHLFFEDYIDPSTIPCQIRIYICISVKSVLTVHRKRNGIVVNEKMNSGTQ